MQIEKHDLNHEFPEHKERIHHLKMTDNHFSRLFNEYNDIDREVHKIEEGSENTSDEYLEELKKKRLKYKDDLYAIIIK